MNGQVSRWIKTGLRCARPAEWSKIEGRKSVRLGVDRKDVGSRGEADRDRPDAPRSIVHMSYRCASTSKTGQSRMQVRKSAVVHSRRRRSARRFLRARTRDRLRRSRSGILDPDRATQPGACPSIACDLREKGDVSEKSISKDASDGSRTKIKAKKPAAVALGVVTPDDHEQVSDHSRSVIRSST